MPLLVIGTGNGKRRVVRKELIVSKETRKSTKGGNPAGFAELSPFK